MLARIVMATAIASLVLLFGAPNYVQACHRGDPRVPHGSKTSCDGRVGVNLTNLVLVDANGNVVGRISNLDHDIAHVIVFTPDQRPFRLAIRLGALSDGGGFQVVGPILYYEGSGCPDTGATYIAPVNVVPDIFHEVSLFRNGTGGLVPWVGTSFEHPLRVFLSQLNGDGTCVELGPRIDNYYLAEQLTDEFGFPVADIADLYPPPLRIEVE